MKSIMSDLHRKYAEKTWNETFQLVRRCMDKTRDESKPCEPLARSLERLQEVFNVSSMSTMKSRLEMIAKQQGMGFHVTEATCYLTADLFYVEAVLLPCGGVQDVKVAPHGGAPAPSESLLRLLRLKDFAEFSVKLAGLFAQYNIPGDNEMKVKLYASLQFLGKDLQQMSDLQRGPEDSDLHVDVINSGRIGRLIAGKEDCPLTVQFYIDPAAGLKTSDAVVQAAQVTLGVSGVTHELQVASLLPRPAQLDPQGHPVFLPPNEAPCETLPACFLLKLQPAVPMTPSFVKKLGQITDVTIPAVDLQWAPLPKLLTRRSSADSQEETEQDAAFKVALPGGVTHSYFFPGAAWASQSGAAVDSVPFTHPAHVPALLELLRHQCAVNVLLRSCVASRQSGTGSPSDLLYEVLPESETSFSVTFPRPDSASLAVLLVNVSNSHQISCTLFGAGTDDPSLNEHISAVTKRCMSIPETLTTLHRKLEETVVPAPLSPPRPAAAEQNDRSDGSGPANTLSQSASVPEVGVAVSDAQSELRPEVNAAVNLYPVTPVGVFSPWMTSNGPLSELI